MGDNKKHIVRPDGDYDTVVEALFKRCATAKIEISHFEHPVLEDRDYFALQMPSGREKRAIEIGDGLDNLQEFMSLRFEDYTFLSGYEAICSYADGTIEAMIQTLEPLGRPIGMMMERLSAIFDQDPTEERITASNRVAAYRSINLTQEVDARTINIAIGPVSREFLVLSQRNRMGVRTTGIVSIKISGATIAQHDQALSILERVANSVFFELELKAGIALGLRRYRSWYRVGRRPRPMYEEKMQLQFPRWEYDSEAISLYWYGCSARGMPLLQFLAYYQTIEFYFPIYHQIDSRRRVRAILKDPNFSPTRETDINRLFTVLRTGGNRAYGDERTQLRTTLQECLGQEEIADFLNEDPQRLEYLVKDKRLNVPQLHPANKEADLRNEIAERLYALRCKIVHTKSSGDDDFQLLLPFSKEADLLVYDIELIKFVCQKVLIASSKPIEI